MSLSAASFIEIKRDGKEHPAADISWWISSYLDGRVADYQMSAWLMAVFLRGMSDQEMVALTSAMLHSGELLSSNSKGPPRIDKHSTGGVGDKISLPLVGIAAACGLRVPMIAGRGLGHTGGTLDKLEAIPGFRVQLNTKEFEQIVSKVGACIIGQTENIAPADRRLYALRDVTGTVACRPLIVASILSKKLAAGLDGLVLDVKVGRGAFMKDKKSARALARSLVRVATDLGTPTVALLSQMDAPLGRFIGNALEVRESIQILKGDGPPDSTELTLRLATEMLLLGGLEKHKKNARARAQQALDSGQGFECFCEMVQAQGGDPSYIDKPDRLPRARHRHIVCAERAGYVQDIDPLILAKVAQGLGAGRHRIEDRIDPAVGIELHAPRGSRVARGAPLCTLHAQTSAARTENATLEARSAFSIAKSVPRNEPLVLERITSHALTT